MRIVPCKHYQKLFGHSSEMNFKIFLLSISLSACHGGKMRLLGDGPVERCDKKPEKDFILNCKGLEFLVENDEAYVNGNCTFNVPVDVWKVSFYTERKMGATWVRAPIQGSGIDVCNSLVDEKEFLHPFVKALPPCPFKKGVSYIFGSVSTLILFFRTICPLT